MGDEKQINQELADPISRLDRVGGCISSDLYVLSRSDSSRQFSYKVSYNDVLYRAISEISARFGFKSMAFCNKEDFAEFDHVHGYSYSNCYPIAYRKNTGQSCIMTVDFSDEAKTGQLSVFSPPLPSQPPPREPKLGEIRFLASSNVVEQYDSTFVSNAYSLRNPHTTILNAIADGTFDGWVYPDGSEYLLRFGKYDFSAAYRMYGGVNGKFTVPVLSNFIRPNNGEFLTDSTRKMAAQVGIPEHSHNILQGKALTDSISIKGEVKMKTAQFGGSNENFLHAAQGPKAKATAVKGNDIKTVLEIGNSTIYYDNNSGDETYPDYCLVPVQIYIGRTKLS